MISFLILIALLALIILGVHRASSKERPRRQKQREPFLSTADHPPAERLSEDYVSIPRIVDRMPTEKNSVSQTHPSDQIADATPPEQHSISGSFAKNKSISEELIVLHLFAHPNRPYRGYELLQTLLTAGLRYSKRGVFHRYADVTARDTVLFSLASAIEPGIFEMPKMSGFSTPGLILFLKVGTVRQPLSVLNLMITTAKEIAQDLGGELYDEKRNVLTPEKISEWRNQLQSNTTLSV